MKFGHSYKRELGSFPDHWVESAISYKKLKKCIKQIERELDTIGVDVDKLRDLIETNPEESEVTLGRFALPESAPAEPDHVESEQHPKFVPKLRIKVDQDGDPVSAHLPTESKKFLDEQVKQLPHPDAEAQTDEEMRPLDRQASSASSMISDIAPTDGSADGGEARTYETVEISLTAGSKFFQILEAELDQIVTLQKEETERLTAEIQDLSNVIAKVSRPTFRGRATHDMRRWRKIFQLYVEANIFVATGEMDHGAHSYEQAKISWTKFLEELNAAGLAKHFTEKESSHALERFLALNVELLRCLKFQELNNMAMAKILKKFSKRSALKSPTAESLPEALTAPLLTHTFSRALCATMSDTLISVVPQIDDYLCPICTSIAYLPVRLPVCSHLFCIRCVVLLQRRNKRECPMCREPVVMKTTPEQLDWELASWMKRWFRKEALAKQEENERATAAETFGPKYNDACAVM